MSVEPYLIHVPQPTLDDLQARLARTRWAANSDADEWRTGPSPAFLHRLIEHWRLRFDWRGREAALNRFAHFSSDVDGVRIHFIHERGRGPNPLPLILTHGFPDSFVRFERVIGMLTDPVAHDADEADAFDVVVPSLPGFGFSGPPPAPGFTFRIGDLWHRLMTDELGYESFAAHGGDWGSTVTEQLARSHADAVVAIHLTDVPFWHLFQKPKDPSPDEQRFLERSEEWQRTDGAYAFIQGQRPDTLAQALTDSPAGLAAWIVDKFYAWSDCHGDLERCYTLDELLTNVMIYWVSNTIGSSFRPYYDFTHAGVMRWMVEGVKAWVGSDGVPAAFAMFPKDISQPPREWAERFFNVQRWTTMPRGGHFAAMEQPELLVDDIRAFFRPFRSEGRGRATAGAGASAPRASRSARA
jgi:pimeloyl-ACP methyl ester carboxylesterase